ncbi:hypothetical protein [Planctomycetes bacterium CA13]
MNHHETLSQIDPAFVARIVRDVVARVKQANAKPAELDETAVEKLITVASVEQTIAAGKKEIRIGSKAIVTPAARDEAKHAGVTIVRTAGLCTNENAAITKTNQFQVADTQNAGRDVLLSEQLARRNVIGSATIVVSDTPAADVYRLCCEQRRAVMVADVASVGRFEAELSPDIWVLDMAKLNLIAAVNVAAQILRRNKANS